MSSSSLEASMASNVAREPDWQDAQAEVAWTIGDLIDILLRRKWLFLAITAGGCLLGLLFVMAVTPVYTAGSAVLIRPNSQYVVDLRPVLSADEPNPFLLQSQLNSEIEVIRSYPIVSAVIDKLGLINDPELNPTLPQTLSDSYLHPGWYLDRLGWLVDMLGDKFREMRHGAGQGAGHGATATAVETPAEIRARAIERFEMQLYVATKGQSMAIVIAYSSADPVKAAKIVNAMMEEYLKYDQERKTAATASAANWLEARLDALRSRQKSFEQAIQSYLAENGLAGDEQPQDMAQRISQVKLQLYQATLDRNVAAKRVAASSGLGNDPGADPLVVASPVMTQLLAQRAELTAEERTALTLYGDKNPRVITARAALDRLASQIRGEESHILQSERTDLALAQTRLDTLQNQLADLQQAPARQKVAATQLNEMRREANANAGLYEEFLKRYEEVRQELVEQQTPDAEILAPARIPTSPAYPQKPFILSASLATSLIAASCFIFGFVLLRDRFHSVEQIENLLRRPALSVLPRLPALAGRRTRPESYLLARPASAYGEAVRSLRTSMGLLSGQAALKSVLFTSAIPNEGKTTTALSFARMAAVVGERAIIIDCDMRRSRRSARAATEVQGLSDLLRGRAQVAEVIQTDPETGLQFISAGTVVDAPADLLERREMRWLVETLLASHDLVVLDSPPVLSVADSQLLAGLVKHTVLVVEWDRTPPRDAKKAFDVLVRAGASILGVAISKADRAMFTRYDYERYVRWGRGESNLLLDAAS